jgi:hemerythrin-like domain-containing protein
MAVETGPLNFLKQEHITERKLLIDLGAAITAYQHHGESAKAHIVELARNFSRHLISHMRREDAILFTLAEEVLDEPAKAAVHQAFIEAEVGFGKDSVAHYEQLASELEKSWSI